MATTNQLQRIADLTGRLGPLGRKTRGMKIQADEWNTLVDVMRGLLEIDRSQEEIVSIALDEKYAAKHHAHPGEISIDWLDASLQARLQDAGGSVAVRAELSNMDNKIKSLIGEVARLTERVDMLQKQIDNWTVADFDRAKALRDFSASIAGLETLRTAVTSLSKQIQDVNQNVNAVLDLKQSLTDPQGKPINLVEMREQLNDVRAFRQNLQGVDGTLVNLKTFELKFKNIEDSLRAGGVKDPEGNLAVVTAAVESHVKGDFDSIKSDMNTLQKDNASLRKALDDAVKAARRSLETDINAKLTQSEININSEFEKRLRTETDKLRDDLTATSSKLIESRLTATISPLIQTQFAAARSDIENNIRAQMGDSVSGLVKSQLVDVSKQLNTQVAQFQQQVAQLRDEVPLRVVNQVETLRESLKTEIDANLNENLKQTRAAIEPLIANKVASLVSESFAPLNQQVGVMVDKRIEEVNEKLTSQMTKSFNSVSADIANKVRDEFIRINFPDQLDKLKTAIEGSVAAKLAGSVEGLRAQISTRENIIAQMQTQLAILPNFDARLKRVEARPAPGPRPPRTPIKKGGGK